MPLRNAYMNSMTNGIAQMYESTFKSRILFFFSKLFQIKETKHYKMAFIGYIEKIDWAREKCRASRFG